MAEAIVLIVVGRLNDLLSEDAQVLHRVKDEIEQVVADLMRMNTFLGNADSRMDEDKIRSLLRQVREVAYDAENVVETYLVKASSSSGKIMQWINTRTFSSKINDIQRKLSLLFNLFRDYNIKSTVESPESSNSSHGPPETLKRFHTFPTVEPEIFVGFQGDVDRLVGHLVDESDSCYPLISICGMGGLGKTTLAQKIYNHTAIKNYFARLAWVSISQKCQTKQVLQRILICLDHEKKEEIFTWDDDKLVNNLLQIQQKKKCLIVLDDIWSNDAWDSIKPAFTAEKSFSKLMLTSRNVDVAEYVNPKGLIHQPEYLSPDQSWELLQLKALPTRGDYLDIARDFKRMEKLGREMVRNCAGLPLAIVILGKLAYLHHLYLPLYPDNLRNFKLRFNGLSKLETLENFDTRWCEVKDLTKLSSLRRLKLKAVYGYDDVNEMFKYLSDIALSSNSCLRYLALTIKISDEGFRNHPDIIRQLLWNHKFNLQELTIRGKLPELSKLVDQQQQLNFIHTDASFIRITALILKNSYVRKDPMPVLEKIPTLRDLVMLEAYMGKSMVCSAMGFPRLTRLLLWRLPNLKKWRVEKGSMRILQNLQIEKCTKLEELPEGLIFLNSLQRLVLLEMPSEFCDRVRPENGEQGPDFYKVAHIPDLNVPRRRD